MPPIAVNNSRTWFSAFTKSQTLILLFLTNATVSLSTGKISAPTIPAPAS
ncbi:MAG: hypothetical protein JWL59_3406 [Chthoniobacteraceae bacterium]|nr:hypothetical protein [Chthoniobacteraceae bacterium]